MIEKKEKEEILRLAGSLSLKKDMEYLSAHRHNPVIFNGEVSMDRLIQFQTEFNAFINHDRKPFTRIIDKIMKL